MHVILAINAYDDTIIMTLWTLLCEYHFLATEQQKIFPAVLIDAGVEILISSYVDDSFAFTTSFLIREFLLSEMITMMTRKTVPALTISKIMIKIVAVKITASLLLP